MSEHLEDLEESPEELHDSQVRLYGAHPAVCSTCGTGRLFRFEDGFWTCTQCQAGFRPVPDQTAEGIDWFDPSVAGQSWDDAYECFGCDQAVIPGSHHVCRPVPVLPLLFIGGTAVLPGSQAEAQGPGEVWGPDRDEEGKEI